MVSVGWRRREWLMLTGCARCHRFISSGVTHPADEEDPPVNALCDRCFEWIMAAQPGEVDAAPGRN